MSVASHGSYKDANPLNCLFKFFLNLITLHVYTAVKLRARKIVTIEIRITYTILLHTREYLISAGVQLLYIGKKSTMFHWLPEEFWQFPSYLFILSTMTALYYNFQEKAKKAQVGEKSTFWQKSTFYPCRQMFLLLIFFNVKFCAF